MSTGRVLIYTDGACEPNPGPGGWAAILLFEKDGKTIAEREIIGGERTATNKTNDRLVYKQTDLAAFECRCRTCNSMELLDG